MITAYFLLFCLFVVLKVLFFIIKKIEKIKTRKLLYKQYFIPRLLSVHQIIQRFADISNMSLKAFHHFEHSYIQEQFYNAETIRIILNNTFFNIFIFTRDIGSSRKCLSGMFNGKFTFLSWTTKQLKDSTHASSFVVSYRRLDNQQVLNTSRILGTSAMVKHLVENSVYTFTVTAISNMGEKASTPQTCT